MKIKQLFKIFRETFLISAFTFGGGYVIVPLMKAKFVDELGLIDEDEMLNMVAIGQTAPGAIAINTSIILGYKLYGVIGALVCCFATVLPPLIVISIISLFYNAFKDNMYVANALMGMRAGVTSLIFIAVYKMIKPIKNSKFSLLLMCISVIFSLIFSPILIIFTTIFLGTIVSFFKYRRSQK